MVILARLSGSNSGLDLLHQIEHRPVQLGAISCVVTFAMTCLAKGNHEPGIVWPSITHAAQMVRLQIWGAISASKVGRVTAALTLALGSSKNVITDIFAALVDGARLSLSVVGRNTYRIVRSAPELSNVGGREGGVAVHRLHNSIDRPQEEDNSRAHIVISITDFTPLISFTNHLAVEPDSALGDICEHEQLLAILRMVEDLQVARGECLWANLTLAAILKDPVLSPPIFVSSALACLASDEEYGGPAGRVGNSALLVTAKNRMNFASAVINDADFESQGHDSLLPQRMCAAKQDGPTDGLTRSAV